MPHWDGSFEYPHHVFWLINKKVKCFDYQPLSRANAFQFDLIWVYRISLCSIHSSMKFALVGAAGSSLTIGTVLCPWARNFVLCLVLIQPWKRPYITEKLLIGNWIDDIPDGGIKTKNKQTTPIVSWRYTLFFYNDAQRLMASLWFCFT